jgi:carbamoyltransferase
MKVLGISLSHDSGITLLEDGRLKLAVTEERFSRLKGDTALPERSLQWITRQLGGDLRDIEWVGFANRVQSDPPPMLSDLSDAKMPAWQWKLLRFSTASGLARLMLGTAAGVNFYQEVFRHFPKWPYRRMCELLKASGCRAPVRCYDHHVCHLLSAVYTSGWNECLTISVDCFGDAVAGRAGIFKDGKLSLLTMTPMYHSIGYYYLFATNVCGFNKGYHGGKVTGLAAYAKGDGALDYFRERIAFDPDSGEVVNRGRFLYDTLDEMRGALKGVSRENIAAAVQTVTEEVLTAYVRHWVQKSGQGRVALSGGVFANVKLNQRIAALPEVTGVFVHPHMGDGGLPTGAAYGVLREVLPSASMPVPYRLPHAFLGPDLKDEDVPTLIRQAGLEFLEPPDLDDRIARLLADGKVVARVAGPMEYGPRALGNRSILYQATDPTVNTWLNHKLNRSEFMPFAPMFLKEDAPLFLKGYSERNAHTAEFMTITYDVTEKCKKESPAVVHIDGTARPQILEEAVNPHCYRILKRYKELSGLSAIINTSYNMHDEPIVRTAADAIRAFLLSELDYLVLDDYLVYRSSATPSKK